MTRSHATQICWAQSLMIWTIVGKLAYTRSHTLTHAHIYFNEHNGYLFTRAWLHAHTLLWEYIKVNQSQKAHTRTLTKNPFLPNFSRTEWWCVYCANSLMRPGVYDVKKSNQHYHHFPQLASAHAKHKNTESCFFFLCVLLRTASLTLIIIIWTLTIWWRCDGGGLAHADLRLTFRPSRCRPGRCNI